MREIKLSGSKKIGCRKYRHAIFECPVCKCHVEKIQRHGLRAKCCSHKCYSVMRQGVRRGSYCDHVVSNGYVYRYVPTHPSARGTKKLYVLEHHLVVEAHIGRYLTNGEVVHHINSKIDDNRLCNLRLMTAAEHNALHAKNRRRDNGRFTNHPISGVE